MLVCAWGNRMVEGIEEVKFQLREIILYLVFVCDMRVVIRHGLVV
jgi:hypothetical protein